MQPKVNILGVQTEPMLGNEPTRPLKAATGISSKWDAVRGHIMSTSTKADVQPTSLKLCIEILHVWAVEVRNESFKVSHCHYGCRD